MTIFDINIGLRTLQECENGVFWEPQICLTKMAVGEGGGSRTCLILLKFTQITLISQEHKWFKEELDRKNFRKNESP